MEKSGREVTVAVASEIAQPVAVSGIRFGMTKLDSRSTITVKLLESNKSAGPADSDAVGEERAYSLARDALHKGGADVGIGIVAVLDRPIHDWRYGYILAITNGSMESAAASMKANLPDAFNQMYEPRRAIFENVLEAAYGFEADASGTLNDYGPIALVTRMLATDDTAISDCIPMAWATRRPVKPS